MGDVGLPFLVFWLEQIFQYGCSVHYHFSPEAKPIHSCHNAAFSVQQVMVELNILPINGRLQSGHLNVARANT